MDEINLNNILERETFYNNVCKNIIDIDNNIYKNDSIKCTFIYGNNNSGKTQLITDILTDLNYNIIKYDLFCQKNKSINDLINNLNIQKYNIIDIFNNKKKKSIILIDNIEIINLIDKNTIINITKLFRPKKSKRLKNEVNIDIQIICISSNNIDKKIKELIKISNYFEIPKITSKQIKKLINTINDKYNIQLVDKNLYDNIISYINYDIRKVKIYIYIFKNNLIKTFFQNLFNINEKYTDIKYITYNLINNKYNFNDDIYYINDTDKTSIALLYHENIIDYLNLNNNSENIKLYLSILDNFCYCDYMDRIIFQKQIWQLNEISFKLKVIYNNNIFNEKIKIINSKLNNIRFTKILTKYSSEFNNYIFIINLTQLLDLNKKQLFFLFYNIVQNINQNIDNKYILTLFQNKYYLNNLDINRMIKFIYNIIEYH